MSHDLVTCRITDDVHDVLKTMKGVRVRRLPVVDDHERLAGIVSLNDIVMRADCRPNAAVSGERLLEALKGIGSRGRQTVAA
jgi:CBS domain-containing protein